MSVTATIMNKGAIDLRPKFKQWATPSDTCVQTRQHPTELSPVHYFQVIPWCHTIPEYEHWESRSTSCFRADFMKALKGGNCLCCTLVFGLLIVL